jgi:hypothetical protein
MRSRALWGWIRRFSAEEKVFCQGVEILRSAAEAFTRDLSGKIAAKNSFFPRNGSGTQAYPFRQHPKGL